ncbi:hypothetical protein Tco_0037643 [Tanacetum coccineum]
MNPRLHTQRCPVHSRAYQTLDHQELLDLSTRDSALMLDACKCSRLNRPRHQPAYITWPEEPQSPPLPNFVPEPVYPEYMSQEDEVFLAEEQPLPVAASPTAQSHQNNVLRVPTDGGDDGDDEDESLEDDEDDDVDIEADEEEEEEHPAPADSTAVALSATDQALSAEET